MTIVMPIAEAISRPVVYPIAGDAEQFRPSSLFAAGEQGVWYDPSDFSTLFQDTAGTSPVTATGQSVARINDKSGRGNHATQANASLRPILQQDSGGRYYLLFDGTDDFLVTDTFTPGTDKVQVFAGVRKLSDAATGILVELGLSADANDGAFYVAAPRFAGDNSYRAASKGTSLVGVGSTSFAAAPDTAVLTVYADISGDAVALRRNGVLIEQSSSDQGSGNYLAAPLYIGRRAGFSIPFNGRVYSLIVRFGGNLDAAGIASTEGWVNTRTGAY